MKDKGAIEKMNKRLLAASVATSLIIGAIGGATYKDYKWSSASIMQNMVILCEKGESHTIWMDKMPSISPCPGLTVIPKEADFYVVSNINVQTNAVVQDWTPWVDEGGTGCIGDGCKAPGKK